jgi:hypothetical protein
VGPVSWRRRHSTVVGGLAGVTGNGAALAVAVDGDGHVDLRCGPAPEGGAVLGVERGGDRFRYGPREHSDVEICSGGERSPGWPAGGRGGRSRRRGRTRRAALSPGAAPPSPRRPLARPPASRRAGRRGTRVARSGASPEPGRRRRARLPAGPQGRRGRAQRRCLTMSEAQSSDRGPGVDERAEHRSQPERLVVGVGVDGEHRAGPGERSNGADGRPVTVSRGHRTRRGRGCPGPPRDAVLDVELAGDGVLVVGDWGRSARRDGSPFVAHVGGGRDCSRGQRPGRRATQAQPRTTGPAVGREVGNDRQRAPHVVGHVVGEKPRPGSVDISPQRVRAHSCICP